jgi:hypothetical protein
MARLEALILRSLKDLLREHSAGVDSNTLQLFAAARDKTLERRH